jgi:hypothetical protein
VRFTKDFGEPIFEARMAELCSSGGAFTVRAEQDQPLPDRHIRVMFSIPHLTLGKIGLIRLGSVCRIDSVDDSLLRVAFQFVEPLHFRPIEAAGDRSLAEPKPEPVTA